MTNNKRIAKNTLLLYFRMLLIMAVSLYTSRVVLDALGVMDFGIYNVVGGFMKMFAIISGAMTTASQRFLSFEIGKGAEGDVRVLFSCSVLIHVILAGIILLLAETVGLWFVNNKMNFPEERYTAVNWVYQFSVLTFLVNVISVPYNAAIIAYERMKAFAYVSVIDVMLKLIIVCCLQFSTADKLVIYAVLLAVTAIGIRIIYGYYCSKNFEDCRCDFKWNKKHGKNMLSFVSWNMIGSIAGVAKEQGINVLLNIFFGAAINAARGVAAQVLHALTGFVSNFQTAMNPQIVKLYASSDKEEMFKLVFRGSKYSFMLLLTLSLPVIFEAPFILNIWLKTVPDYTVVFLQLVLFTSLVDSLSGTLIASMHASGKVRDYQIVVGGISLCTLPLAWVLLRMGYPPTAAMAAGLVMAILCHFARLLLLKYSIGLPMMNFIKKVTFKCALVALVAALLPYMVATNTATNWISFLLVCTISVLSTLATIYFVGLSANEKTFVVEKTRSIVKKFKK